MNNRIIDDDIKKFVSFCGFLNRLSDDYLDGKGSQKEIVKHRTKSKIKEI